MWLLYEIVGLRFPPRASGAALGRSLVKKRVSLVFKCVGNAMAYLLQAQEVCFQRAGEDP